MCQTSVCDVQVAQHRRRKLAGQFLDLFSLYKAVTSRGGFLSFMSRGLKWAGRQAPTIFSTMRHWASDHDAGSVRKVCSPPAPTSTGMARRVLQRGWGGCCCSIPSGCTGDHPCGVACRPHRHVVVLRVPALGCCRWSCRPSACCPSLLRAQMPLLLQSLSTFYEDFLLPYEEAHPEDVNWHGDSMWLRAEGTYSGTVALSAEAGPSAPNAAPGAPLPWEPEQICPLQLSQDRAGAAQLKQHRPGGCPCSA